jgi:P-type conjugative transfer ATPase TrbB
MHDKTKEAVLITKQRFVLDSAEVVDTQEIRQFEAVREDAGLLWKYLQEPDVTDVVVNADGKVWIKRAGAGFSEVGAFPPHATKRLLLQIASIKQVEFNHRHPILQTDFPLDGSRIEGVCSPVAHGAILALRTRPRKIYTIEDFVETKIVTDKHDPVNMRRRQARLFNTLADLNHAGVIDLAIRNYLNIVIAGATGSGKTTGINMLLDLVKRRCPYDRVLTIEDTMELQCTVPNTVALFENETHNVTMWDCLKASMRLIPTRIVVGEVRDAAAHVMLMAWHTGHPGGFASVHANHALEALYRIEQCLSMPGRQGVHAPTSHASVRSEIARVVNLILFFEGDDDLPAGRKLREVLLVKGYDPETDRYDYEYV